MTTRLISRHSGHGPRFLPIRSSGEEPPSSTRYCPTLPGVMAGNSSPYPSRQLRKAFTARSRLFDNSSRSDGDKRIRTHSVHQALTLRETG